MKKIKVEDAVGLPLMHDITRMARDYKGPVFRRGHVIKKEDIEILHDIGKKTVYAGEAEKGMIHEEECALRLSDAANANGAHFEGPSEGKVVLISDISGMFRVNNSLLNSINEIGDITISCIPDHFRVGQGDRLASMRIVPLYTDESQIIKAEELCKDKSLFEVIPFQPKRAGVIITGSEIFNRRVDDLFEPVVRKKLSDYPCEITGVVICDDDLEMIINSARSLLDAGSDLLIFAGGMSVDPDDLTPQAIRALASEVISHGVCAQPGNMTEIAYLGDVALLGIPGAAVNLPVTIFDVLLPQIFAGIKFSKQDLLRLAQGGLCMGCRPCHFPRCTYGRY